jgi:RecA-family ATPase
MSISHERTNSDGRRQPDAAARAKAARYGGEPEDYMEKAAYAEWNDAKLVQAGFVHKKTYIYHALNGAMLYQVLRYEHGHVPGEKRFTQRSPAGVEIADAEWFRTAGHVKVIYNWPEVARRADEVVHFAEGEKDADRLMACGLLATTVAGQNWSDTCVRALAGREVWIYEDNDEEGRANALASAEQLRGVARSIRIVRLPGLPSKGDVSDWLDAGHSKDELLEIGAKTPEWEGRVRLFNPAEWGEQPPPERIYLVPPLLPAENVTLLYGDGGNGKSLLALDLAASRACDKKWLGLTTLSGRTLVLSAEDDLSEMHRRLAAIALHHGFSVGNLGAMRLIDLVGQDAVIGELNRNGRIVATELYQFVVEAIESFHPDLVIVDALADSFAGDENNRVQARQFISMLRRPAVTHHCAFLAIAHPSLSGITTGRGTSGSTGWSNSVRARMYLETLELEGKEPDPNLRVLRQPKANYAEPGFELALRYERGVFVPAAGQSLDRLAKQAKAEEVFMIILRRLFAQGRFVGDRPGVNYAPALFAQEAEATEAMISKEQLKGAMVRLFQKATICKKPYGEPSKGKTRLEEAAEMVF